MHVLAISRHRENYFIILLAGIHIEQLNNGC